MAEGWEKRFPGMAVAFGYECDADRITASLLRSPHELIRAEEYSRRQAAARYATAPTIDETVELQAMRAEAFFDRGGQLIQYLSMSVLKRVLSCDAQRNLMVKRADSGLLQVWRFPDTQGVKNTALFERVGKGSFAVYHEAPSAGADEDKVGSTHGHISTEEGQRLIAAATGYFEALDRISVDITSDL